MSKVQSAVAVVTAIGRYARLAYCQPQTSENLFYAALFDS